MCGNCEIKAFDNGREIVLTMLASVPVELHLAFLTGVATEAMTSAIDRHADEELAEAMSHG